MGNDREKCVRPEFVGLSAAWDCPSTVPSPTAWRLRVPRQPWRGDELTAACQRGLLSVVEGNRTRLGILAGLIVIGGGLAILASVRCARSDRLTAALKGLFYRNLWLDKLPPCEALRQAQLAMYRNPGLIGTLARTTG